MYRQLPILLFLLFFAAGGVMAQDSLDLQQCVNFALQHNTQVQRGALNLQQQQNNLYRSRSGVLPNINGNASHNYNFGRTIDPYSNQFVDQHSQSNAFSLSADWTLFNGFQKENEMKQTQFSRDASRFNLQKSQDDISLSVANAFLQTVLLTERQKQLENLVANSKAQQQKTQKLLNAGAVAQSRLLETEAQLANDEAQLADISYQLTKAYLQLKIVMNYDITKPLRTSGLPELNRQPDYTQADLDSALNSRLQTLPSVLYARNMEMSNLYGLKSTRGYYSPRLSLGGSLHTVYSSLAQKANFNKQVQAIGITQDSIPVFSYVSIPHYIPLGFSEQLKNNYGQSLGFNLSVPIFNGLQTRYAVQNALINLKTAKLARTDAENTARNDIYSSFENMQMSKKKFMAAQAQLKAQEALFHNAELTYNSGGLSYFDYNTARVNYSNAQSQLLSAKYDFLFQTKVFEYYAGKPLKF